MKPIQRKLKEDLLLFLFCLIFKPNSIIFLLLQCYKDDQIMRPKVQSLGLLMNLRGSRHIAVQTVSVKVPPTCY